MAAAAAAWHQAPWKGHFETLERETGEDYSRCMTAVRRYPRAYVKPAPLQRRPRKSKPSGESRKILLSTGTIIVCPANLVQQWNAEITKHTVTGSLKVLTMEDNTQPLPSVEVLLDYDIILFSRPRFDKENLNVSSPYLDQLNLSSKGKSRHSPYCKGCNKTPCSYKSPVRDMHWKRIIVDEVSCLSCLIRYQC